MNITNDNMMCNILTVLKRPKMGARGGKKRGKRAKNGEKWRKMREALQQNGKVKLLRQSQCKIGNNIYFQL